MLGSQRLSELCASGISQLLNLAKSLLSSTAEQEDKDSSVWPKDCLEKAKLIRAQAQAMADDIEVISVSFVTGIILSIFLSVGFRNKVAF